MTSPTEKPEWLLGMPKEVAWVQAPGQPGSTLGPRLPDDHLDDSAEHLLQRDDGGRAKEVGSSG